MIFEVMSDTPIKDDFPIKIKEELNETLKRITSHRGVVGAVVVGNEGLYFPTVFY